MGSALDIAASTNAIAIGKDESVKELGGQTQSLKSLLGNKYKRVAVEANDDIWAINSEDKVMHYNGNAWADKGETAIDIGVGGKGPIYIISKTLHEKDDKGYTMKFYDKVSKQWSILKDAPLNPKAVSGDQIGNPLVVDYDKKLWH